MPGYEAGYGENAGHTSPCDFQGGSGFEGGYTGGSTVNAALRLSRRELCIVT